MPSDVPFARFVSLACHDLRTPLATVHGFARTLPRVTELGDPAERYVGMIASASQQMADLLDQLGLIARIEGRRYEPALRDVDTLELAQQAAQRLEAERVHVDGEGATVSVDVEAVERAVAAFASCALRHGGLERVEIVVRGPEIAVRPLNADSRPVILAQELKDVGAAFALRVVKALGGSAVAEGEELRVNLPPSG
jgi:signal transduction histidine kinase